MTLRHRILPVKRRKQLKELLASKSGLRIIEAHNGLSGLVGSTTTVEDEQGNLFGFDGLWVSSLTDSAAKGHPDTEVIDTSSRLQTIQELLQVTNKPIIVDGDTGGQPTQFEYFCSKLENLGVSAVIIEDKKYPKRNSLEKDAIQLLEDPKEFATKVNRAKEVCLSNDFMIFTRIESFIAGRGLEDAVHRASIYLDSMADGILIHSNAKTPDQIYAFMEAYQELCDRKGFYKPVVCVPTTYNQITDLELFEKGFSMVIYANHQLRAAYRAMTQVCQSILSHQRSFESVDTIASVSEIMDTVGFPDVKTKDVRYQKKQIPVVILGSGKPMGFVGTEMETLPVSNMPIAGLSLIEWQVSTLKEIGLKDITLLSGYGRDQLPKLDIEEIYNRDFTKTKIANSLMMAREKLSDGFILLFGDIIFDKRLLINYLLNVESNILLLVDNTFNLNTRHRIKPTTDLVSFRDHDHNRLRKPNMVTEYIADIGPHLPIDRATHEFIGIAKFSKEGARLLEKTYDAMVASSPELPVDINMLMQSLIRQGIPIEALEVSYGWSEVHTLSDIAAIEKEINRNRKKRESYVTTSAH